jgi:phosphoenolpyruvate phosphomutase
VKRAKRLRQLLFSKDVAILMEAHNGLSAKLAEEAGFQAIWGSGLAISAALGVRDSNEASWTQILDVMEFMTDATDAPILLDGDTGYGNFNTVRRLVRKLEQRNIAGVCIEDKLFPKTNSFIDSTNQPLAEVDEFCGKIAAAKDTQRDSDFIVVARTEAFITGWGVQESLLRATAYAETGADLILVHTARSDSQEILSFMKSWELDTPVMIVPTKYPSEPLQSFKEAGISNFIFANHSIRTVITALQKNLRTLRETSDLMSLEDQIAPVVEIFRLQNTEELRKSEQRYFPTPDDEPTKALVLAATRGHFGTLVENRPQCMLYLRGKPVLTWHIEAFNRQDIKEIGVVRGYRKETVNLAGLRYFDNDDYESTGELYSLYKAREFLTGNVLIAYGDILFDNSILQYLLSQRFDMAIAADASFRLRDQSRPKRILVSTIGTISPLMDEDGCRLARIGEDRPEGEVTGEWVGLLSLRGEGTRTIVELLDELAQSEPETLRTAGLDDLLNLVIDRGFEVEVRHTYGHWRLLKEQAELSPGKVS